MLVPFESRHHGWKYCTIKDNHEDCIQPIAFVQVAVAFDRVVAAEIPNDFLSFINVWALFIAYIEFVAVENLKNLDRDQCVGGIELEMHFRLLPRDLCVT